MPNKKSTKPLMNLCINMLTEHIISLQKDAQHLPPILRNELYENREKLLCDNKLPANVFITAGTRKLKSLHDLNENPIENFDKIIELCHNLRHFNLSGLPIDTNKLQQMVKNNPKLETLDFSDTKCCSRVLDSIGKNCHRLKQLNIANCRSVDDTAIRNLCNKNMKISTLNISHTCVTIDGCLFVINNLPCLTNITHEKILQMIEAPKNSNKLLSESIQIANSFYGVKFDGQLQQLSVAFPNLRLVSVYVSEETEILPPFSNLPQLEELYIEGKLFTDSPQIFDIIRPTFQLLNNLTDLILTDLLYIDVVIIGRSCPKLRNLCSYVCGTTDFELLNEPCPHILFGNLEVLSVLGVGDHRIAEEFQLLLSNCLRLKELKVFSTRVFDDELIKSLLVSNPMKHLESLLLWNCPRVSTEILIGLMGMDNSLHKIHASKCRNVDVDCLIEFVDEECLDVEIVNREMNTPIYIWMA